MKLKSIKPSNSGTERAYALRCYAIILEITADLEWFSNEDVYTVVLKRFQTQFMPKTIHRKGRSIQRNGRMAGYFEYIDHGEGSNSDYHLYRITKKFKEATNESFAAEVGYTEDEFDRIQALGKRRGWDGTITAASAHPPKTKDTRRGDRAGSRSKVSKRDAKTKK